MFFLLALFFYFIWFFFLSYKECDNWDCFNSRLEDCKRTKFIGGTNLIFEYTIFGKEKENCKVGIELLQGEINNKDSEKLVGQEMDCYLPYGVVMIPESKILNCHGELKEGLQDLIITKLHTYIVQNIGKVNLEIIDDIPEN